MFQFVGQITLPAFAWCLIATVSAGTGIRGQPIFINEINTAPLSSHESSQFIELEYADNWLFQRHSSNVSGPSLKGFYVLVIKGSEYQSIQVSESPMISVFINISGQHFSKNKDSFLIGDTRGLASSIIDLPLQSKKVVCDHFFWIQYVFLHFSTSVTLFLDCYWVGKNEAPSFTIWGWCTIHGYLDLLE